MKSYARLFLPGWLALAACAFAQEKPFYLKNGDCVVFYGDSITDQRLYTAFTETFVVTRFPSLRVTFVHSGWGGDRVSGGGGGPIDRRLDRDVFAYQPTVMTIMLGMNDGSYRAFDQNVFDPYRNGYQHIIDAVKQHVPGIRVTLIQPSPYDDVMKPPQFAGGYNGVLIRYGQFVKELAEKEHLEVADLNTAVVAALEKAKGADAEQAKKIIPDRVHPGPAGHLLMAAELLKAWHAPSTVAAVILDAANTKAVKAQAAKISGLQGKRNLSWTEWDESLPMPVDMSDSVMALAINSSDFVASLNQQLLQVTGLAAGKFGLKIDGALMGEFTSEQFAGGINLALLPTPMVTQAKEVHKLTLKHNDLHFLRWRQIQVPLAGVQAARVQTATKNLMTALDEEEAELVKQQHQAAMPVEHKFEIVQQ